MTRRWIVIDESDSRATGRDRLGDGDTFTRRADDDDIERRLDRAPRPRLFPYFVDHQLSISIRPRPRAFAR